MIVIIGEIGVGKFIVIDVFGFCFGGCVEVDMVCIGVVCVDLCVCFFLKDMLVVLCWLEENQFEDGYECLFCCVISSDGCFCGFINGIVVFLL